MHHYFEYELTRDEYVAGLQPLLEALGSTDPNRERRIWEGVAAVTLAIFPAAIFFPSSLGGVLTAAMILAVAQTVLQRRWARQGSGASYDPKTAAPSLRIDDDGLHERIDGRERHWEWSAVRGVHRRDKVVSFQTIGWDMVIVPDRLWADGEDRSRFLEEVAKLAPHATTAAPIIANPPLPVFSESGTVAAISAGADAVLLLSFWLFPLLIPQSGVVTLTAMLGNLLLLLAIYAIAAVGAYKLTRWGLRRLHARSRAAASIVAQALIWALPLYLLAALAGLI